MLQIQQLIKKKKNISDINYFLGKIQNAFISAADIVIKKNFLNKNNLKKCKQQKQYLKMAKNIRKYEKIKPVGTYTHKKS